MINNQKADVCYNVQMATDSKHKLIIDYEVTNEVNDEKQLSNMSKRAKIRFRGRKAGGIGRQRVL